MINKEKIKEIEEKLRIEFNENKHLWSTSELRLTFVILGYVKDLNNMLNYPENKFNDKMFK